MRNTILVCIAMLAFSSSAMAGKEFMVEYGGKNIVIKDVDTNHKKLIKNVGKGIYIEIRKLPGGDGPFLNAAKLARASFEAKGIKIVDKLEDADVGLQLGFVGDITEASVDTAAVSSATDNIGSRLLTHGIGSVAMKFVGGSTEEVRLTGIAFTQPTWRSAPPWSNNKPFITGKDSDYEVTTVEYKREKDKGITDDVIFSMTLDQWIEDHVAYEKVVPKVVATPASAVSETTIPDTSVVVVK